MTFQPTLNTSSGRYSPDDVPTYTQLLLCSPSFQEVSTYAKLIACTIVLIIFQPTFQPTLNKSSVRVLMTFQPTLETWHFTDSISLCRPWASLYPLPPPLPPRGGFYHMVISGYLDHQSTQFRLSASELVAVCVCGAGSNKCTIWNSKLRWPCLLATHLLWQKRSFPYIVLLFEQFNML